MPGALWAAVSVLDKAVDGLRAADRPDDVVLMDAVDAEERHDRIPRNFSTTPPYEDMARRASANMDSMRDFSSSVSRRDESRVYPERSENRAVT